MLRHKGLEDALLSCQKNTWRFHLLLRLQISVPSQSTHSTQPTIGLSFYFLMEICSFPLQHLLQHKSIVFVHFLKITSTSVCVYIYIQCAEIFQMLWVWYLQSHTNPTSYFSQFTHKRKQKQVLKFGEGHLVSQWQCGDLNLGNLTSPRGLMPHATWPRSVAARSPFPAAGHCWPMLHSTCQPIWKTQQWPQDWKRSVFTPVPKKGNPKECSNYRTVALISHAIKVMFKILPVRFQQYMTQELPNVQAGFRKGRGTRDQIANICCITEKAKELQKNIDFCFIDYAKAFDCVDHNKLWKISEKDGNTRPPDLLLEKPLCRSGSNS